MIAAAAAAAAAAASAGGVIQSGPAILAAAAAAVAACDSAAAAAAAAAQQSSDSEMDKPSSMMVANCDDIKMELATELGALAASATIKSSASPTLPTLIPATNSSSSTVDHHQLLIKTIKRRKSDEASVCSSVHESVVDTTEHVQQVASATPTNLPRKKNTLRTQLAHQIVNSTNKVLKKPLYVVRPSNVAMGGGSASTLHAGNYALDPTCMLAVFRYLPPEALVASSMVCKTWSTLSVDPTLWRRMNCSHHRLSASLLTAIVRRQPEHLILDWTTLAKRQLTWVIARIPALKHLSIQGTPISAVLGLHTCTCPPLQKLDMSFVRGLNDSAIRDILSPPKDSRPGLTDSKSRLRNLKVLKVAGTDITDVALRYITQGVPSLIHLDLSSCQRITDAGVAQIGTCTSAINTLVELDLSSCKLVTESCLEYLTKCEALTWLDLRHVPQVSTQAVIKFAAKSKHNLQVRDIKLVDKRKIL